MQRIIRAVTSGVLVLVLLFACFIVVSPFLGAHQPQLIGCQTGLQNMRVVDKNASRPAPSYGFWIDRVFWCGVYFDNPHVPAPGTD